MSWMILPFRNMSAPSFFSFASISTMVSNVPVREDLLDRPCAEKKVKVHCNGIDRDNVSTDRPAFADRPADANNSSNSKRIRFVARRTGQAVSIVGIDTANSTAIN